MENDDYSQLFDECVVKVLTAADLNSSKGHQHEFNGVAKLKKWFLGQKTDIKTKFVQINSEGKQIWTDESTLTWYNARENSSRREEFRMYYHKSVIFSHFNANDLMVILFKLKTGIPEALMISVPMDSLASNNIAFLLKIQKTTNLPAITLTLQMDERIAQNIAPILDAFLVNEKKNQTEAVKERSTIIRGQTDLSRIISDPDACLFDLYSAEKKDGSNVLSGYYEQLSIVLIRNGIFFSHIKDNGVICGINLGTFNEKTYRLYTCDDEFNEKINPIYLNYCVLFEENLPLISRLDSCKVVPIVLKKSSDSGKRLSLFEFIQDIKLIQGAE